MTKLSLKAFLDNFQSTDRFCNKIYCSTCGGKAAELKRTMTPILSDQIIEMINGITIDDFLQLGEWKYFINQLYPDKIQHLFIEEAKNIDLSNVAQLDNFIFESRNFIRYSEFYQKLIENAIKVALNTSDESLIETLIIILSKKLVEHKELLELAKSKSKSNKSIHKALYNSLRDILPEVRGYVGDGNSTW